MNSKKSVLRVTMRKLKKEMGDSCLRDFELVLQEGKGSKWHSLYIFFRMIFF